MKSHKLIPFKCKCKKTFDSLYGLTQHIRERHINYKLEGRIPTKAEEEEINQLTTKYLKECIDEPTRKRNNKNSDNK